MSQMLENMYLDKIYEVIDNDFMEAERHLLFMNDFDIFTESEDENSKGAIGSLKNAIDKLIKLVKALIQKIKDFVEELFMDDEERMNYQAFKKFFSEHPELGKEQVTVQDFKEFEKAYDEAIKELESASKKESFVESTCKMILNRLEDKIKVLSEKGKEVGKRGFISITLSTLLEICNRNKTSAQVLNTVLKNELVSLEGVEKELGKDRADQFKKSVDKLSRQGLFHRFKVQILQRKEMTLMGVLKDQFFELSKFVKVKNGKISISATQITKATLDPRNKTNKNLVRDISGSDEAYKKAKKQMYKASAAEITGPVWKNAGKQMYRATSSGINSPVLKTAGKIFIKNRAKDDFHFITGK